jgi:hypothetical protein
MRVARLVVRLRQARVAGTARTVWVCFAPRAVRLPGVQASLGINCRREPQRSAIASQLASPTRCPIVFRPLHDLQAFSSLYRGRAEGRGLEPPRGQSDWDASTRRWSNARRRYDTGPAVKTRNPPLAWWRASAVGGIRAWAENPGRRASSVRLYSCCGRYGNLSSRVCSRSPRMGQAVLRDLALRSARAFSTVRSQDRKTRDAELLRVDHT